MRRDVAFNAEGATLRGWFYLPDGAVGPAPVVVMSHGYSAVKEMGLEEFAQVFSAAGLAVLVYDHRRLGASDGEPRQEIDPWAQVRDCRHAITFARTLPEVDRNRVGVWGFSYSGGHALVVGAVDRRVACAVSMVPVVSGYRTTLRLVPPERLATVRAFFDADREARFAGTPPTTIPVVSADPTALCALSTRDSWKWFSETASARAPVWRNEVTLRSIEMLMEYEPGSYIDRVSPTPLLMIVAAQDCVAVADEALATYHRALEPKKLVILRGGHFDGFGDQFDLASSAACEWFVEHLKPTR